MHATSARPAGPGVIRSRWRRKGPFAGALVGVALAAAACGGGGGGSNAAVAHVGKSTSTTAAATSGTQAGAYGLAYQKGLKYTQCMRKNGVLNFPEPNSQGDFLFKEVPGPAPGGSASDAVDPNSPAFQSAQKACKELAPPPPTASQASSFLAGALKLSKCMRANGVPNFPDPTDKNGQVAMTIPSGSGINLKSPQFQKAMQACRSFLPPGAP
jgi:hypothetical protein